MMLEKAVDLLCPQKLSPEPFPSDHVAAAASNLPRATTRYHRQGNLHRIAVVRLSEPNTA